MGCCQYCIGVCDGYFFIRHLITDVREMIRKRLPLTGLLTQEMKIYSIDMSNAQQHFVDI